MLGVNSQTPTNSPTRDTFELLSLHAIQSRLSCRNELVDLVGEHSYLQYVRRREEKKKQSNSHVRCTRKNSDGKNDWLHAKREEQRNMVPDEHKSSCDERIRDGGKEQNYVFNEQMISYDDWCEKIEEQCYQYIQNEQKDGIEEGESDYEEAAVMEEYKEFIASENAVGYNVYDLLRKGIRMEYY